jgi:hypothetical protein
MPSAQAAAAIRSTRRGAAGSDSASESPVPRPTARRCEFKLANRRYCYPLTITDFASRYLLTCEALATTQEKFAFTVFDRVFKEFGLPPRDPHG